ncbi:ATP-binding protein [Massilia sp. W12]|uniref:ATP-binding protein n=1 Tax=Massilia sp. W12 TaxID=3126507 RepID=UPI0030D1C19A
MRLRVQGGARSCNAALAGNTLAFAPEHADLVLLGPLAAAATDGSPRLRWQQVAPLLAAGLDVYASLQVQDLASMNQVVSSITGQTAPAQVPDQLFDQAYQVVLVDLPVDAWLQRIRERARQPADSPWLHPGNLLALQELAQRRAAERGIALHSSGSAWLRAGMILCVGSNSNEAQIAQGIKLAQQLQTPWQAVHVAGPNQNEQEQRAALHWLQVAEQAGAQTVLLHSGDVATALARYAREQGCSHLALGQSRRHWPWQRSLLHKLSKLLPNCNLVGLAQTPGNSWRCYLRALWRGEFSDTELQAGGACLTPPTSQNLERVRGMLREMSRARRYVLALALTAACALLAIPFTRYGELINISMLLLLTVIIVALRFGRKPAALASISGGIALYWLAPPTEQAGLQHVLTTSMILGVGMLTGKLTADLRYQAGVAAQREERMRALYAYARSLSSVLQNEQVFEITREYIQTSIHARAIVLVPNLDGKLQLPALPVAGAPQLSLIDIVAAQHAFDQARAAWYGSSDARLLYLPLVAKMRTRGVLAIQVYSLSPDQRNQLDTFATMAAIALERVHYGEVAQDALIKMESERLRNSLLSALSHDLRTPLTSLVGLSESLLMGAPMSRHQTELATGLRDEALRMSSLVSNLLDMARIEQGQIRLNWEWHSLEEIVGTALRASRSQLQRHQVQITLPPDLPLLRFDAVLIERVLCNLLENAAKYTPSGCSIRLSAQVRAQHVEVRVHDNGPGIPRGREQAIFEKFARGEKESGKPGVGLGLSICRALVQAHGGRIWAEPVEQGACFVFNLPWTPAPALPDEPDDDFEEDEHERPGADSLVDRG